MESGRPFTVGPFVFVKREKKKREKKRHREKNIGKLIIPDVLCESTLAHKRCGCTVVLTMRTLPCEMERIEERRNGK